jgi:hypothetical protein
MRAVGLRLLFVLGVILGFPVALILFFVALAKKARPFHPTGTTCRIEVTALDTVVGPRLAGSGRVRLSGVSQPENSTGQNVIGCAFKFDGDQDLPLASFESFLTQGEGTKNTNVADYLGNEYASVTPWHVKGIGIVWLRAVPAPEANTPKTGTRVERLDADIAAKRASFVLEARDRPFKDGPLHAKLAEIRLTERIPDDLSFRIRMTHTGKGLVPTGFRNGIRFVVYPFTQLGRGLRGG